MYINHEEGHLNLALGGNLSCDLGEGGGGGADTPLPDDAVGVLWEDDDFSAIVSRMFQQQGLISFFGFGDDQPLLCPPLIGTTVLSGSSYSSLC